MGSDYCYGSIENCNDWKYEDKKLNEKKSSKHGKSIDTNPRNRMNNSSESERNACFIDACLSLSGNFVRVDGSYA